MPSVSVIVPHKDSPETLCRLLESIPDAPDIEVIVVDDNSRDSVAGLVGNRYNARLVNIDPRRSGAGAARNIGMSSAKGEWYLFADADDYFLPGAFTEIRRYLSSDSDVVYFSPTSIHDTEGATATRHSAYAALVDEYLNCGTQWVRFRFHVPWSKLVRSRLVEAKHINFAETIVANDIGFSIKVGVFANRIEASSIPIYCVTQSYTKGLSANRGEEFFDVRMQAIIDYNDFLNQSGLRSYRMSVLSSLRKAAHLGIAKLLKVVRICLAERQPLFDHWDYNFVICKRWWKKIWITSSV